MKALRQLLNGKKTYILAGLLVCLAIGERMNWLTHEAARDIFAGILGLGLASLRAAVEKNGPNDAET